jgi:O-acetyl-ADP-ribose deacetylase (regulator of RNase III)
MLTIVNTNLFDSPAECLTNPVNTAGVMGKGLALEFKRRFPALEAPYRAACRSGILSTQHPWLWYSGSRYVLCLATKAHWKQPSRLETIEAGLQYIQQHQSELPFTTLSLPLLGCGLGGLSPNLVIPLIEHYLAPLALASTLHLFQP